MTVSTDEDGEPFEAVWLAGQGRQLPARRHRAGLPVDLPAPAAGTPLEEIIDQCRGIQEMQPFFNTMPDGKSVAVLGLGDGIAHILKAHLKAREERKTGVRRPSTVPPRVQAAGEPHGHQCIEAGQRLILSGGPASHLQEGGDDDGNDD